MVFIMLDVHFDEAPVVERELLDHVPDVTIVLSLGFIWNALHYAILNLPTLNCTEEFLFDKGAIEGDKNGFTLREPSATEKSEKGP